MDPLASAVLALAACLPAIAVLVASRAWRGKLSRPKAFVAIGLGLLYFLAGYLLTRAIPTHAVGIALNTPEAVEAADAIRHEWIAIVREIALTTLIELAAASAVVVFALKRLLSRKPSI